MKKLIATTAALVLLSAAPAFAMSCCGGGNGKAGVCSKPNMKGGMAMNTKTKKCGCCCEGMAGGMSKRS